MGIDATHPDYDAKYSEWKRIDDIVNAKNVTDYLIYLVPSDTSPENVERNRQYRERAIFYQISGQTVQGMVGSIFRKVPEFTVPENLSYLANNADGAGVSIYQQSQATTREVLTKGRGGIAVSFPQTEGQVSRADLASGRVVATIHSFKAEQILNWQTITDGSRVKLSLVTIMEVDEEIQPDGYTVKAIPAIREMYLDDGIYTERIWHKTANGWQIKSEFTPTDATGAPWAEIPFAFVGANNNDHYPDNSPMSGIVDLNVGHYRNSADFEHNVWFCGQAQAWMSGITQDHIDLLKTNGMYIGGPTMIGVPEGESFGFASAPENTMVKGAMDSKVEMMIALGARMMQVGSATKTASQVMGEREAQTSTLALVAGNVSEAYTKALEWAGRYMGAAGEMEYKLSDEFVNLELDAQLLQQVVAGYLQGAIPASDYSNFMRRYNMFRDDVTNEEYADLLGLAGQME
jgi:hypothetical protein